jgi:glucose-1-phosphate adenylyltransferase
MGTDFFQSVEEIGNDIDRGVPHIGIGENSVIRGAIIDKNVRIGKNVKLLNQAGVDHKDGENGCYYIREGIIIVPKNATIADGTEI